MKGVGLCMNKVILHKYVFLCSMSVHLSITCDLLHVTTRHFMDTWQSRLPSTRKIHQKL